MEKLVLVPYNKYQRLLDAQPVKRPSPTTPLTMPGQSDRPVTRQSGTGSLSERRKNPPNVSMSRMELSSV